MIGRHRARRLDYSEHARVASPARCASPKAARRRRYSLQGCGSVAPERSYRGRSRCFLGAGSPPGWGPPVRAKDRGDPRSIVGLEALPAAARRWVHPAPPLSVRDPRSTLSELAQAARCHPASPGPPCASLGPPSPPAGEHAGREAVAKRDPKSTLRDPRSTLLAAAAVARPGRRPRVGLGRFPRAEGRDSRSTFWTQEADVSPSAPRASVHPARA